jgi:3-deoxy-D-manno-octulosonic-acid transferase
VNEYLLHKRFALQAASAFLGTSFFMIWIYRILFLPVLALSIPYFLWHAKRRGGYKKDLHHKFGKVPQRSSSSKESKRIWIQAVSVGEIKAIKPLIETLNREQNIELILTTTTSTGYRIAHETYKGLVTDIYYFPLDFVPFTKKAWRRIQPDLCLLMEGELWPEHIHQAKQNQIPILLINARLSDKTYRLYQRLGGITRHIFQSLDLVLASSDANTDRFQNLGTHEEQTITVGNLKCDMPVPDKLEESDVENLLVELGLPAKSPDNQTIILCGASTWNGEELALVKMAEELRKEGIDLRLIITPRHVERRKEIETDLGDTSLNLHFRSQGIADKEVQVAVADTTGELIKFIQLADIVFVGRSLNPHTGGQTPIEAGMLGKPVVFGPGMANFRDIARSLVNAGIATQVADGKELTKVVRELSEDSVGRQDRGRNAKTWLAENQGATQRTVELLRRWL